MNENIIYLGKNNFIEIILQEDGVSISLTGVTKIELKIGEIIISSTNEDDDPILWKRDGYEKGEIHFILGKQKIEAGLYDAFLIIYDPIYVDGFFWGRIPIIFKEI